MKKIILIILIVFMGIMFSACRFTWKNKNEDKLQKLTNPILIKVTNDYAYWGKVLNANSYIIKINEYEIEVNDYDVEEAVGDNLKYNFTKFIDDKIDYNTLIELHIRVKAKGDSKSYSDSDWSNEITYSYIKNKENIREINEDITTMQKQCYGVSNKYYKNDYTSYKDDAHNCWFWFFRIGTLYNVQLDDGYPQLFEGVTTEIEFKTTLTSSESIEKYTETATSKSVINTISHEVSASYTNQSNKTTVEKESELKKLGLINSRSFSISGNVLKTKTEEDKDSSKNSTSYASEIANSDTKSVKYLFNSNSKKGFYSYMLMGNVDVYKVVIYDCKNSTYIIDEISIVGLTNRVMVYLGDYNSSYSNYSETKLEFDEFIVDELASKEPKYYKGDNENYAGGFGTKEQPYLISNETHLKNISINMSKHFKLINDIEITDKRWQPLGTNRAKGNQNPSELSDLNKNSVLAFTGTLNGNNKTIKYDLNCDLLVTKNDYDYAFGLFGLIRNAEIKDLKINASVYLTNTTRGNANVAGLLCGWAINSKFIRCQTSGKVSQNHGGGNNYGCLRSGGLVGLSKDSYYEECINYANVLAGAFYASSGGIVGGNTNNRFNDCKNYGSIKSNHGKWIFGADNHGDIYGVV